MNEKIFGLLVFGIITMFCATAYAGADLEITRITQTEFQDGDPVDGRDLIIKTDIYGHVEFDVLVENTESADKDAEDVKLILNFEASATDATITVSPTKRDIDSNDSTVFTVNINGIEPDIKKLAVEVEAEGEDEDGDDVHSPTVQFFVSYASPRLEITEPSNNVDILELGIGRSFKLNVFVKNVGDTDLFELKTRVDTKYGNVSCEIENEIDELKVNRLKSIRLSCINVNDGDGITVKVRDSENQSSDLRSIELHIIPGAPIIVPDEPVLRIQSPMNGEVIQLKEENNQIPVTVINEGNLLAERVCVSWTGVEALGGDCTDIAPNETQTYVIAVLEIPESADVIVTVGDKEGLTTDMVSVSVIKGRTTFDVEWEENQSIVVESNVTDVKNTSEGEVSEPVEEEDPTLKYIIVGVVVLILVVYMAIGMTRKRRTGIISQ
jgi:hypothetical protein